MLVICGLGYRISKQGYGEEDSNGLNIPSVRTLTVFLERQFALLIIVLVLSTTAIFPTL
jgi:hypothetical protein